MNNIEIVSEIKNLIKAYYKNKINDVKNKKEITLSEPNYDEKEIFPLIETALKGWISQGKNVSQFERDFAKKVGCKYAIACNSGSSANLIAIQAMIKIYKLKSGDEVIIPASTFATVVMPIIQSGLIPVYVDVDLKSLNLDVNLLEKAISRRTKIIMPVHTLGLPCDMQAIMGIAKKYNLHVFEDCCEAHGAKINNRMVGSFGVISAFSFFVAHNITTGEGGMVLTNNKKLAIESRSIREFGRLDQSTIKKNRYYSDDRLKDYDKRYLFTSLGYNLRMTDLSASLGVSQVKKLNKLNLIRRKNAQYLGTRLIKNFSKYLSLPGFDSNYFHTYYTFPILLKDNLKFKRVDLTKFLEKNNIQTRPLFAGCLPDQPGLRYEPHRVSGNLINSRYIRDNLFFIGIHPQLNKSDFDYFINVLDKFITNHK